MTIVLNSTDLCVQGLERLRKHTEFILCVPVTNTDTRGEVLEAMLADMACCDRGDDFDWDGCRAMLQEVLGSRPDQLFAPELEDASEDDNEGNPCYFFMYCEQA